jgi:hypothetical protein
MTDHGGDWQTEGEKGPRESEEWLAEMMRRRKFWCVHGEGLAIVMAAAVAAAAAAAAGLICRHP